MIDSLLELMLYPRRAPEPEVMDADDEVCAYADAAAQEYLDSLDDTFVKHALSLGVSGGVLLDVGTGPGLIPLKILWHNENFYAIGIDASSPMIERARATAAAWKLTNRIFFQVGDARRMHFKASYFDLVISNSALHHFAGPVEVLAEINRVTKPQGGILIRDLRRPSRWRMSKHIEKHGKHYSGRMRELYQASVRAAYTPYELGKILQAAGIEKARVICIEDTHVGIERRGITDSTSWVREREKYL